MAIEWELKESDSVIYKYSGQYRGKNVFAVARVKQERHKVVKIVVEYGMEGHSKVYEYEYGLTRLIDWKLSDRTYFVRTWRYGDPTDHIFPNKDEALSYYDHAGENGECSREHVRDSKGNILESRGPEVTWPTVKATKEKW